MKKIYIILFIALYNFVTCQESSNYSDTLHTFNKSLIFDSKIGILQTKMIEVDEKIEGKYLGQIITKSKNIYYLVGTSRIFNIKISPTAESHIFIYNNKKQYIGFYYLNTTDELPTKLFKNKLYFKPDYCNEIVIINFSHGIPRAINLKCGNKNNFIEFQN